MAKAVLVLAVVASVLGTAESARCDFEQNSLCQWVNANNESSSSKGDWTLTNSIGLHDHTTGSTHGHYAALKSSVHENTQAWLISPTLLNGTGSGVLSFWYHVPDYDNDVLTVNTMNGNSLGKELWSHHGKVQGGLWAHAKVNLTGSSDHPLKVSLVAVMGSAGRGDIIVDDIDFCVTSSGWRVHWHAIRATPQLSGPSQEGDFRWMPQSLRKIPVRRQGPEVCVYTNLTEDMSPADCDFESQNMCGYHQISNDDMDWTRQSGRTPSSLTGPSTDHTLKNGEGHYIYMEASRPQGSPGRKAYLASPAIVWHSPTSCVRFWYNMYGSAMGNLTLIITTPDLKNQHTVWELSGNQGQDWHSANVTIDTSQDVKLMFKGTIGSGYYSDIGVDDITVQRNSCDGSELVAITPTSTPTLTPEPTTVTESRTANYNCDFEANTLCEWKNVRGSDDRLDWSLTHGKRPADGTGPSADHTRGNAAGHYIYIETNHVHPHDSALLVSPMIMPHTRGCLTFWYNMRGHTTGSLTVYSVDSTTQRGTKSWSLSRDHGDHWFQATVPFFSMRPFWIVIRGEISRQSHSYIAIDDITYTAGKSCSLTPAYAKITAGGTVAFHFGRSTNSATSTTDPLTAEPMTNPTTATARTVDPRLFSSCDFEQKCGYGAGNGDFQWTERNGKTPTQNTGPSGDHTVGRNGRGHYVYSEGTGHPGKMARFWTGEFPASQSDICVQFYYHMYGGDMGTLNVKLMEPTQPINVHNTALWTRSGDQKNEWHLAQVTIPSSQLSRPFKVVFESVQATNGQTYLGDMAVDDILIAPVPCPLDGDCSFEMRCTWNNVPVPGSSHPPTGLSDTGYWNVGYHGGGPSGGPSDDHTFNNTKGKYLFFIGSSAHSPRSALLISEDFQNSSHRCVTFWYYLSSPDGVLTVSTYTHSLPHVTVLWRSDQRSVHTGQWIRDRAPIDQSGAYQILFKAMSHIASTVVAIDDISFQDTSCHSSATLPTTIAPATTTTTGMNATLVANTTSDASLNTTSTTPTTTTAAVTPVTSTASTPTTTLATTRPIVSAEVSTTTTTPTTTTTEVSTTTTTPTTTTTEVSTTTTTPTTTTTEVSTTTTTPTTTTTEVSTTTTTPTTTSTEVSTTTTTPTTTTTEVSTTTTTPTTTTTEVSTTTTTPTTTTTEKPNICQRCRNLQCFTGPETVTCTPEEPLCASHVTDTNQGMRTIAKGCISHAECDAWTPTDLELQFCLLVDKEVTGNPLNCLFCCHGDLCNKGPRYIPEREGWAGQNQQNLLIG